MSAVVWSPSSFNPAETGTDSGAIARLRDEAAVTRRYQRWAKALPPLLALHRADPGNHIYLADLAGVYRHLGRYREEAAMWEQYMDHAPLPIEGCPQIGRAYEQQGQWTEALAAYRRCLGFDSDNLDSMFHLAHALERHGELDEAEALYRKGYARRPGYTDFGIGLARTMLRKGETQEALGLVVPIVKAHPDSSDALLVAGLASDRFGDRLAAERYFRHGAVISRDPDFQVALARLAERDGNLDQAIEHYSKAVEIEGAASGYASRLALLRKARE